MLLRSWYSQDGVASLIDAVIKAARHRPDLSVREVTGISGYSSRHLQRIFLKYVGFTTKEFLEILRFEAAVAQCGGASSHASGPRMDCGEHYYDQSHFIKSFKRFSGQTPRQFSRDMSDLYNTSASPAFIMGSI